MDTKEEYQKATITLSTKELQDILYDDSDQYDVIKRTTTGHWRHGTEEESIIQSVDTKKFFKINWRDSSKDEAEFRDMNTGGTYTEVIPQETIVIEYLTNPTVPEATKDTWEKVFEDYGNSGTDTRIHNWLMDNYNPPTKIK